MSAVKCPFCSFESSEELFKQLRSSWKFRLYTVKMYECHKCHGIFNYYEGVSSRGRRSVFVIRVRPRHRRWAS